MRGLGKFALQIPLGFQFKWITLSSTFVKGVLKNLTVHEKRAIHVMGLLVPALMFVDDIVFRAKYAQVIQGILDALSQFYK